MTSSRVWKQLTSNSERGSDFRPLCIISVALVNNKTNNKETLYCASYVFFFIFRLFFYKETPLVYRLESGRPREFLV